MTRDDFRKAFDAERELRTARTTPLPPWARQAVVYSTTLAFVAAVAGIGAIALAIAYVAVRFLSFVLF
jgi:hypothetical protein